MRIPKSHQSFHFISVSFVLHGSDDTGNIVLHWVYPFQNASRAKVSNVVRELNLLFDSIFYFGDQLLQAFFIDAIPDIHLKTSQILQELDGKRY
jgi:hypothetical protein